MKSDLNALYAVHIFLHTVAHYPKLPLVFTVQRSVQYFTLVFKVGLGFNTPVFSLFKLGAGFKYFHCLN